MQISENHPKIQLLWLNIIINMVSMVYTLFGYEIVYFWIIVQEIFVYIYSMILLI